MHMVLHHKAIVSPVSSNVTVAHTAWSGIFLSSKVVVSIFCAYRDGQPISPSSILVDFELRIAFVGA